MNYSFLNSVSVRWHRFKKLILSAEKVLNDRARLCSEDSKMSFSKSSELMVDIASLGTKLYDELNTQNLRLERIEDAITSLSSDSNAQAKEWLAAVKWSNRLADVTRLSSLAPIYDELHEVLESRQLSMLETVQSISNKRLSFARFGDGEFRLMLRPNYDIKFQRNSPQLANDLRRILTEPVDGLLIGVPQVFHDLFWSHMWADLWPQLRTMIGERKGPFGNAHVSRPPYFSRLGDEGVQAWRSVWDGRDVAVVAGAGSKFELVPELFDNLKSVSRVDSLPEHAYLHVLETEERVLRSGADLALISLGPAGTVLASRLAVKGIQALDIGHLSSSWESIFQGADTPERR
ncbi:GT-D fold domain-containing glycosyltransferase [Glutamicibacter creatinolyticus]|uniref:GT-D fold domain-containing glycosyltransferase n=1 Tax=Glutamicibacter creatinolyticus TaxID=162496 RepID=UPI0031D3433C